MAATNQERNSNPFIELDDFNGSIDQNRYSRLTLPVGLGRLWIVLSFAFGPPREGTNESIPAMIDGAGGNVIIGRRRGAGIDWSRRYSLAASSCAIGRR